MIKNIKIGHITYNIYTDKLIDCNYWGKIYYDTHEIRIQKYSDGRKVNKAHLYQTLLHEAVHGIDHNVIFSTDDEENCINLIALYIIKNINILQNCNLSHFENFLEKYEINIKRKKVVLEAIMQMLNENPKLTRKLKKVFGCN